jgi:hypothetical protein
MHGNGMSLLANNLNRMSTEDLGMLGVDMGGWQTPDTEDQAGAIAALMDYVQVLNEMRKSPGGLYGASEELHKKKTSAINQFKIKAGI